MKRQKIKRLFYQQMQISISFYLMFVGYRWDLCPSLSKNVWVCFEKRLNLLRVKTTNCDLFFTLR